MTAKVGEKVTLTAEASDPDDDKLTYKWWHYFEADTYQEYKGTTEPTEVTTDGFQLGWVRKLDKGEVVDPVELKDSDTDKMFFTIPDDAKSGDSFHIVIEVTDDGAHTLKAYQRVIVTVD